METEMISFERCFSYTQIKPEQVKDIDNINKFKIESGVIEFKGYSSKYRKELKNHCLKNISFKINDQDRVGIVGRTGSGKSSLFLAILGMLQKTEGSILISNQDVSKFDLQQLRQQITVIQQETVVFQGTIRENLNLGN